jgi:hypothetical protein
VADDTTTSDAAGSLADLVARQVVSRAGGRFGQSVWTCLEPADTEARAPRAIFPSGFRGIDRLLPAGGIGSGSLVEWIGEPASGVATLAFAVAGGLRGARPPGTAGPILVVDRRGRFYPPAVMPWLEGHLVGKPKAQVAATGALVVVRPSRDEDEIWAIDQALRCPGLTAVVAWPENVSSTSLRRWQLAARGSGTVGLLVRPVRARREPSWAEARLNVSAVAALGRWRGGDDVPWAPAVGSLAVRRHRLSLQEGPWACEQPPDLPTVEIALDLATGREAIGDADRSSLRKAGPWSADLPDGRRWSPGVLPDANGAGGVSCRAS